ncbi:cytochrome C biogenesis protein [Candidatus Woesearchaeota archaeon]|nr:cytochrome C biogenesis protein [Candidatus Woesearchaeota archaeon]
MVEVTIIAAFLAGIVSFLSPCILPLIPGFLAYLAGVNPEDSSAKARTKMFLNSLIFVLGFSAVFSLLGVLLNSILEKNSYTIQLWLSRVGGVIIILFGFYVLKLIKIPFLEKEHKLQIKGLKPSYFASFLFGAAFAVGWTPCVGAVLGAILTLALTNPGQSFYLLLSYAIGLGIPFLIVGIFSTKALTLIKKNEKFFKYFNVFVGIFLITLGVLVFTQQLSRVASLGVVSRLVP